jgi:galactose mutarotase-like enzyme
MGLSHHGPWRDMTLTELSTDPNISILEGVINEGDYTGVVARQTASISDDQFSFKIRLENGSEGSRPANLGVHGYFDAPQRWEGTTVNGTRISREMLDNRTNKPGVVIVDLSESNIIQIPGQKPVELRVKGFKKAVIWVFQKSEEGNEPVFDENYICIEPIQDVPEAFGKPETEIPPGGSTEVEMTLRIAA